MPTAPTVVAMQPRPSGCPVDTPQLTADDNDAAFPPSADWSSVFDRQGMNEQMRRAGIAQEIDQPERCGVRATEAERRAADASTIVGDLPGHPREEYRREAPAQISADLVERLQDFQQDFPAAQLRHGSPRKKWTASEPAWTTFSTKSQPDDPGRSLTIVSRRWPSEENWGRHLHCNTPCQYLPSGKGSSWPASKGSLRRGERRVAGRRAASGAVRRCRQHP
jgi:hypothetical protein